MTAIPGRGIFAIRPRVKIEPATTAPVFPGETNASASAVPKGRPGPLTSEESRFPRTARTGGSSIPMTSDALKDGQAFPVALPMVGQSLPDHGRVPRKENLYAVTTAAAIPPFTSSAGGKSPPITSNSIRIAWGCSGHLRLVPKAGLEPARACYAHMALNHARLPIPPPRQRAPW